MKRQLEIAFATLALALTACASTRTEVSEAPRPVAPVFEVIPLQHTIASDLVETLGALLQDPQQRDDPSRGDDFKVMADTRTNSLLVMVLPHRLEEVRMLVQRLDS